MGNSLNSAVSLIFGNGKKVKRDYKNIEQSDTETKSMSFDNGFLTPIEGKSENFFEVSDTNRKFDETVQDSKAHGPQVENVENDTTENNFKTYEGRSNLEQTSKTPNFTNDDEFVTVSECTCTPLSRSPSFQTASEGGAISPWWELDPTSDFCDKIKSESSFETVRKQITPTGINYEMSSEIVVKELTETTSLKMSSSENQGVTSYSLEKSSTLLRPDMSQMIADSAERSLVPEPSNAEDIIRQLSEIVKNNESYIPDSEECVINESSETSKEETLPKDSSNASLNSLLSLEAENDPSQKRMSDSTVEIQEFVEEVENSDQRPEKIEAEMNDVIIDEIKESKEWFQLKVLEVQPELTRLGETLIEAVDLLTAHEEVLRQLESKQSPVEELLRQADQLIATQRPRAEVYAAMAESLGLAWKDVNSHLEDRKNILELNVTYKRKEQKCFDSMEQLEIVCQDVPVPIDIESVKELISRLHSLKRSMLESLNVTLQEGKILLEKLKKIANEGTLDSRPDNIRVTAERAVSKVEHWLEVLHDKRKIIETSWQMRKSQVEKCLALALLATELLEVEDVLRRRKESLADGFDELGNSKSNAKVLLDSLNRTSEEAKELQEKALRITNSTEKLVSAGHFAGEEAVAQSYAILNDCAQYMDDIDKREELLNSSVEFFELAEEASNKLDEIQIRLTTTDLPATSSLLAKLHSDIANSLEETTETAVTRGHELLERVRPNARGAEGVRRMVEELQCRRINLEGACTAHREKNLEISESLNNFLEKYNEIYSWLITNVEAFLQGHQDMGSVLAMSRDFLNLHTQLLNELKMKETELKSHFLTLPPILHHLDESERNDLEDKVNSLQDHWVRLKSQLETRIELARSYVKFHSVAVDLSTEFDSMEDDFKKTDAVPDERIRSTEEKWLLIQQLYIQLSHIGKNFIEDAGKVMDPHLDVKRASLCIKTVLDHFGSRQSVISESWQTWQCSIDNKKEVKNQWERNMADSIRTLDWVSNIQPQLYPILLEEYDTCKEVIKELERKEQIVIPEIKKAEAEIEMRLKTAELIALKGEAPPEENEKIINELMDVSEKLGSTSTNYQVLIQMLQAFFKNLSEVEKTIEDFNAQNETSTLPSNVSQIDGLIKDNEAFSQAILELFKFTKNESDGIINKINILEPESARQADVNKINQFLDTKQKDFESKSVERKFKLEQHRQLCQFDNDLREINSTLSELNNQLISIRGQYGESLPSAKATSQAFVYFEKTIELLEQRIKIFVKSGKDLLSTEHDSSGHIESELKKTQEKWDSFYEQVKESRRLIDLSIQYFTLVEEAEEWFKEGNRLLVTIARKTTTVKTPEEATELLNEVELFLKPGEVKQDQRIRKISELALQLYGVEGTKYTQPVLAENQEMIDSFTLISEELSILATNLRQSEEERERLKKENDTEPIEAEVVAAKAAVEAAEEASKTAENAAQTLKEAVTETVEIVEIEEIITTVAEGIERQSPEKLNVNPPEFVLPLNNATVKEGEKFLFECKVTGNPTPKITWWKEGISVDNNPDYQTKFNREEGLCSLNIEETFTEDSATFTCRAVNEAGSAETHATLSVTETVIEEVLTPPKFVEPLVSGHCQEGKTYEFRCFVDGYPLPTVQWFKGDICVDNSPDYVITYNNGEAVLRFEQVFLEDQSEYTCKASNKIGSESTTAYLSVEPLEPTSLPQITTPLSNVMARAGQKVRLECGVNGQPEPEIFWSHDGKPIKSSPGANVQYENNLATLVINETFPKDAGTYTVIAKNIAGEVSSSCNLVVKGLLPNETSDSEVTSDVEPIKPSVQLQLKDQSVFEGKTVRLECIIVGQPEPEVIWYHDGVPVKESDDFLLFFQGDHCSLVIREVYVEDAGNYKVVAINSAGEASSSCHLSVTPVKVSEELETKENDLDVEEKPVGEAPRFTKLLTDILVDEGEKVLLECCVKGDPEPDIRWYLNNQSVNITERTQMDEDADGNITLTLLNVAPEDKGVYTVKATNSFGEVKCFAQLIVKPKAKPAEPEEKFTLPVFKETFGDATVNEDDGIKFECVIVGKPTPKVKWHFNDEPVEGKNFLASTVGDRYVLAIPRASKDDSGVIACLAENEVGRSSCSARLTVRESSLQQNVSLVPFIEPIVTEDTMETSSFSIKKQFFVESSSSTQMTSRSNGGEPQVEVHSFSTHDEKSLKQIDQQPVEEVKSHLAKEYHQLNEEKPQVLEESSVIVKQGGQITQECVKSNSILPLMPKLTRKSTAPRFISPLQGKIVDQGSDIELEGIVDGYPQPSVTWTKNGNDLESKDGKLSITFELNHAKLQLFNVDVKDAGRYTCKASNSVGSATSTADVVVKKSIFPPVLGKRLQSQTLPKGERARMEVEVTGTPDPTVTWYKDDEPIKSCDLFRIITQGNSHILIIERVTDQHSGRYMVKATNAGGMAQSIADFNLGEAIPNVGLTNNYSFENKLSVATHEKPSEVSNESDIKMDKTITESTEKFRHVSRPFSPTDKSIAITETLKTEKKVSVRMERSHSPALIFERKLEDKIPVESDIKPTEKVEEVPIQLPHEEENEDIDRSSITKRSALDFFKTKMKENEEATKNPEPVKSKPLLHSISTEESEIPPSPEVFSKQSEIVSQLKTVHLKQESTEDKMTPSKPVDAISLAKESYSIVQEEKSSFNKFEFEEKITEPILKTIQLQRKEIPSPAVFENGFNLTPEPPPEMGFIPKPEKVVSERKSRREDISEKVKRLEEFHKVSSPVDIPSGGVRLFPIVFPKPETPVEQKQEIKETKKVETERTIETLPPLSWLIDEPVKKEEKIETVRKQEIYEEKFEKKVQSPPAWTVKPFSPVPKNDRVQFLQQEARPVSPRPSAEGLAMEKLWATKTLEEESRTVIVETPKPISKPETSFFRPASSLEPLRPASPRPSAEGVAMEKLWTPQKAFEPARPATSLGLTNRCASPKPSQEGLAMDKIWAHKHKESNLKVNWPPPQEKGEKPSIPWVNAQIETRTWPPPQENIEAKPEVKTQVEPKSWQPQQSMEVRTEVKTQIEPRSWQPQQSMEVRTEVKTVQESFSRKEEFSSSKTEIPQPRVLEKPFLEPTTPVQYYVSDSRLIRQTRSMDRQDVFIKESKSSQMTKTDVYVEDSLIKPSAAKKLWPPPPTDLQAPSLVKQVSTPPQLQPGPPPEIGFAAPPERRTSLVEIIEKDLKKEIQKQPSKQLPGAVRIIPPPPTKKEPVVKPKKEMKRASSLDSKPFEKFPELEPFPYKPDPPKPKPARCPPPPTPTKFIKGRFAESDYESDYESRISVKWRPYESDGEEIQFRRVRPPTVLQHPKRPQSTEPEPLPPSKFEKPPEFEGPPRPIIDTETRISSQTKKEILKHFSEPIKKQEKKKVVKTNKPASPPKLKPGSPPEYFQPSKKPDSPKAKQQKTIRPPESGYMADTDEPFILKQRQKSEKTVVKESSVRKWEKTSQSYERKSTVNKELISPSIVQQITTAPQEIEPFPFKAEPMQLQPRKVGPPPPSPSKFTKGDFRESDYESDYDSRIHSVWNAESKSFRSVRPILTPSSRHANSNIGRTPTPPTEFEIPPRIQGPSRPKFEPIAPAPTSSRQSVKLDQILQSVDNTQTLIKPKPVTPKAKHHEINLKPGSPPQIAFAPAYPKAVETSNIMSFQEATETSRRVVNLQQTTRLISFGKDTKDDKPKFPKSKFNESDYESDLEGMKLKDSSFRIVQNRPTSVPVGFQSNFQHLGSKSSFISTSKQQSNRDNEIVLQPGEPPEFGFAQIPVKTATSYANKHMKDMTHAFKSKAQQFVNEVFTDVKKPEKPILKSSTQSKQNGTNEEPRTYREENRLSECGTKHIDPDTGLIYFKYDFGYEFGIVLPGEGGKKSVSYGSKPHGQKIDTGRRESIDFPIIHETTTKGKENQNLNINRPKKLTHHKTVKWDGMSESEMSEMEDIVNKKRYSLPQAKGPQIFIPGNRWESTPSPVSLSPSLPSLSPKYQRLTPIADSTASPSWLRGSTPTSSTPGLNQKNVTCPSNEPLKSPNFITPLRDIAVVSGQPARFECIVQAEPTPNILWSKDGRIIEHSQFYDVQYKNGVCRLTITQAYPDDAGTYSCTATNMVGTAGTTATLQVPGERRGVRRHF